MEFKTSPGLGHAWKNEDIEQFLVKFLQKQETIQSTPGTISFAKIVIHAFLIIIAICLIGTLINKLKRR